MCKETIFVINFPLNIGLLSTFMPSFVKKKKFNVLDPTMLQLPIFFIHTTLIQCKLYERLFMKKLADDN